jgi:alpha-beta hydrolase superfamily lysophospholipase
MTRAEITARSDIEERRYPDGRVQLIRRWEPPGQSRASVLLVHGYAEHSGRYEQIGGFLADAGYAVWTTDLRGHGRSSGERATVSRIEDLLEDACVALDLARSTRPGLPVFVLGHSMGGLVATRLALDPPCALSGLVLSGPAIADPAALDMALAIEPFPELGILSEGLSRDPEVVRDYDEDPLNYRGPFRRETLQAFADAARVVRARSAELTLPVLILHGGDDPITAPSGSEDLFTRVSSRDKRLEIYPGLRHEILNEPEGPEIGREIVDWIAART